jgi:bis(5'-nucleosyl)-tetraphosphatase (symmetrical)
MLSREVESMLVSERAGEFLSCLYGDDPRAWRDDLEGFDRLRVVVNACTRLRFCAVDGTMEFREKRGPESAPEGYLPWFMHPQRASAGVTVVCGHWSTLELKLAPNLLMLDSGCLWGGALTAVRLEDRRVFQVPGASPLTPKPLE